MRVAIAAAVLANLTVAANAQDCVDRATTFEISECLSGELKQQDAELNRVYQAALKTTQLGELEPKVRKAFEAALRDSQRKWVAFRDADCRELTGYEWYGGSGSGNASASCMVQMTRARAKDLKDRYEGR